jgi:superfamily II RNA helicase
MSLPDVGSDRRRAFVGGLSFELDGFQVEAMDVIDRGDNVLVSAPTGSGKTLVASYGVSCALDRGEKAFYTTPLKALSNQKFVELVAEHGADRVGLLTGDTAIRPQASIVVMTTEVLRNMLLTGSGLLEGLGAVILDEVHFIQDPYRGGVWEEVLILTPAEVQFICLSATVANASVLGEWIETVRGPTAVITERRRPITLRHHVAVTARGAERPHLIDLLDGGRVSEEGLRIDQAIRRRPIRRPVRSSHGSGRAQGPPRPYLAPRRSELLELLDGADMLPGIVFIFSRAGCDDAVRQVVRDGLRLVGRSERQRIRAIAEHYVDDFDDDELRALGYAEWVEGLEAGIAAHHAGLVPAFREAVEACFSQGLLGVVFATETLSLGINMPARTVVLERFSKFGGAGRATLTSGEYAQMTGRAGRRGLDDEGHAVVAFSFETSISEVARVAVAPPPDLHSSFRPTYNLACNLVQSFSRTEALELLAKSFAQFEVDHHHRTGRRLVAEVFARRMAVLEELGYVHGWTLTDQGHRLRALYHEADLLMAEMLADEVIRGAEPAVIAGVLSGLIFEPRRARRIPGAASADRRRKKRGALPDRLGEQRRRELADRLSAMGAIAERIHGVEEVHLVPRTRSVEPGLATAVAAWARGAELSTVLAVAARDCGEIAPGDFVRVVKQVADLAEQISLASGDHELSRAAREVVPLILRSVVAGGPEVSASPRPAPL